MQLLFYQFLRYWAMTNVIIMHLSIKIFSLLAKFKTFKLFKLHLNYYSKIGIMIRNLKLLSINYLTFIQQYFFHGIDQKS